MSLSREITSRIESQRRRESWNTTRSSFGGLEVAEGAEALAANSSTQLVQRQGDDECVGSKPGYEFHGPISAAYNRKTIQPSTDVLMSRVAGPGHREGPSITITTLPRAWPASRYRIASGTSASLQRPSIMGLTLPLSSNSFIASKSAWFIFARIETCF
jgi:hypothetical protein